MDISVLPPEEPSSRRPNTNKHNVNKQLEKQAPFKVVFVIGAPGAGKGTICKQVAEKLGYYHLSAGDYLRDLANRPSDYPKEAYAGLTPDILKATMKGSSLLGPEKIVEILRFKLEREYASGWKKVIVDGFPRTVESAWAFEKVLGKPSLVILADCPKRVAASRFLGRGREKADTPEKYEKRHTQFVQETPAILRRYRSLYKKVDTNCDQAQAVKSVLKPLETQETIVDRTRRVIADTDWKARMVVGAALILSGVAFKRRFWRR